ncbi:MAG TPA: hypothetical protein VMT09_13225 [Steroidobacteraceae bacterium]|nr:hypothetical protein [Steroidobacteraceae bacterium]
MSVAARTDAAGKTRTCPHCKATILETLTICPGCLHHLRFDQQAAKRQAEAASALRVEGVIAHPATAPEPWEYFVVISVRNERGEEVARQVVNVGALRNAETRTFTLSVEVMQPQPVVVPNKPVVAPPPAPAPRAPPTRTPTPAARPAATGPAGAAVRPGSPQTTSAGAAAAPKSPAVTAPPKGPAGPLPPKR